MLNSYDLFSARFFSIIDSLVPASQRSALEDVRRSMRVIYVFMVLAVCFAAVLGVLRYLRGDHVVGLAGLATSLLCGLTPWVHRLSGSANVAVAWLASLATLLLWSMSLIAGRLFSTAGLWFGPLVVFVLVTFGERAALVWVALIAMHSFTLYWCTRKGLVLPDLQNPASKAITWAIAIPASLLMTIAMLKGFVQAYHQAIANLDRLAGVLLAQTRELRQAKEEAEAATRSREDFIAMLSHEIRNPLNGILGVAQLLKETPLNPEQQKLLQVMNISAEGLLSILNDVLDFSKIQAGKLELRSQTFNLRVLCNDCIALFSGVAKANGLELRAEFGADVPAIVVGDPLRIRQVLMNLLGNATKFTATGSVVLSISADNREPESLQFIVEDTGIGMSASTIANLFTPYTQADSSVASKHGGTGLGLAICLRLTEMLGGRLTVESVLGQGARFILQLPLKAMGGGEATLAPVAVTTSTMPRDKKVLLIEGNEVNRMVAIKMLEALGARVEFAVDGKDGLAKWQTTKFDVIFMDCLMPTMDGYEAVRQIRHEEQASGRSRTPIIGLTADALDQTHQCCIDAGMDDVLTKPIKIEILRKTLQIWLG